MNTTRLELTRRGFMALAATSTLCAPAAASAVVGATLFVIARSKNENVVHYDARLSKGKLVLDEPLAAYWVLHAEGGRREPLTFFERELAYGFRLVDGANSQGFRVRLQAFPYREIRVVRDGSTYRARVRIGGHEAVLERIFVSTDERGVTPVVRFLELHGTRVSGGARVTERLTP